MIIEEWLWSGLRISLPLVFAAFGGMLCEKSGLANIALEATLLFTSFAAAAVTAATGHLLFGVVAGIAAGLLVGVVFGFFTIKAKADQIIVGTALNILAAGIIPVFCKAFYGVSGQTPSLSLEERITQTSPFIFLALAVFIFVYFIFQKSVFGLRIIAAGDNPHALRTQGVNVNRVRWGAVLLGNALVAFGGIYLSIGAGSGYTRNMSAGRGFIALAALIFGRWKPVPTFLACLFFGLLDAMEIFMQNASVFHFPTQFIQAFPYVVTLIFLAGFSSKNNAAPAAINRPDQ